MDSQKGATELAVGLTTAWVKSSCQELNLKTILETLCTIHAVIVVLEGEEAVVIPADPHASIGQNAVTCLECGKQFELLCNRHLALHGLTPREYKKKQGIKLTQSLSCVALTTRRRQTAKQRDTGQQLAAWRAKRKAHHSPIVPMVLRHISSAPR